MHTFVIPVYKESPYLEQCILSLKDQSVNSAVILTTSTPSPFSEALALKYGLNYYVNDKKGIASDWNFALSKVSTPLATIAHQDDIYEPGYATRVIESFRKNADTLITFTGYRDIVNGRLRKYSLNSLVKKMLLFPFVFKKSIRSVYLKKMLLLFGDPICCPSVTFNLAALQSFSFSSGFTCALDWYAWFQLAGMEGAFCFIKKKLIMHRIHAESETTALISQGIRRQEELQMFRLMWGEKPAAFISWFYTLGYAANKLQADA